ncbi:MAG: glycoside hydrolase family 2 protein [Gracilimonas sp.]|uniref:glycoside hydrolase family 2 protein n=1 Tax=Gracilimonas sp. TaxID=1974203 RepID=UPI0019B88F43|nr:glycoside hydrolase family 2 TIM barrel-domain containing protein [Gracilimonas sp.]MBD3617348.1 glycoside hydrolase family 2 protein [Gracilimonas sp.]
MSQSISRVFIYLFFLVGFIYGCNQSREIETVQTHFDFNTEWEFVKDMDTTITDELFEQSESELEWEQTRLPHTANIEPLVIEDQQWQGDMFYRKFFEVDPEMKGKHITLKFEGAMHEADIYLNGEKVGYNAGGYLPFVVNITDHLKFDEENVLLVKLNNEDNSQIPPGKAIEVLDFNYYGGIYRDVYLAAKDLLRISDPIEADRVAGGGILVSYENVSDSEATVSVQTDIENGRTESANARLKYILQDADGNAVTSAEAEVKLESGSNRLQTEKMMVRNPNLWSPASPYLYTLTVQLFEREELIDSEQQRIGIRTFGFDDENQFVLNGERLYLRGTNRHQDYPYIGYALSNEAQYRDAYKIKEAGFNFIRIAHYPPDPAFLEAADELGLLFMDAIPGWQYYEDGLFAERALKDVRKMVRRDRNHPGIIFWEASLNESEMPEEFMDQAHQAVKEELPIEDNYTSGWADYAYDIFIPARQHSTPPEYWSGYSKDKPLFIAEYGDWEYYAQNAGFNQDAFEDLQEQERTSRQLRGDGQRRLAQQALNFQEAHNSNLKGNSFGDANWVMFDYNRGYAPDIESSGIWDIFRIPKFANYFYQSQAGPELEESNSEFYGPMAYIANYWSDPDFTEVRVYSNAEEVALLLNGEEIARKQPDINRVSTELNHPPFTFELDEFTPGTLKAEAYIDGEVVATDERITPQDPAKIEMSVDLSGKEIQSGVNDAVFIYANITDEDGTTVWDAENPVEFRLEGEGELIGHNPINAEAGIATILFRAGEVPGTVTIKAFSEGLEAGSIQLTIN